MAQQFNQMPREYALAKLKLEQTKHPGSKIMRGIREDLSERLFLLYTGDAHIGTQYACDPEVGTFGLSAYVKKFGIKSTLPLEGERGSREAAKKAFGSRNIE